MTDKVKDILRQYSIGSDGEVAEEITKKVLMTILKLSIPRCPYAINDEPMLIGAKDKFGKDIYEGDIIALKVYEGGHRVWKYFTTYWNSYHLNWGLFDINNIDYIDEDTNDQCYYNSIDEVYKARDSRVDQHTLTTSPSWIKKYQPRIVGSVFDKNIDIRDFTIYQYDKNLMEYIFIERNI